MSDEVRQIFIRNDQGKVWGPLSVPTVELLVGNGLITGKLQLSEDGLRYADPGVFPHLRAAIPRELWGETAPGATVPMAEAPIPVVVAEGAAPVAGPPSAAQLGMRAGPGTSGAAPSAGAVQAGPAVGGAAPSSGPVRAGPGFSAGSVRAGPGAARAPGPPVVGRPAPPQNSGARPPPAMSPSAGTSVAAPPQAPAATPLTQLAPSNPGDAPPASGELSKHSAIHLYYLAASGDHTGLLSFKLSDRVIEVHFRKGNPEFVGSTHEEDSVAGFMLKSGVATSEQVGRAEAEKAKFGGEIVATLFGLGILNPATAFGQLAQHSLSVLMKALLSETGTFSFEAKDLPAHKALPLGNRWAVLTESVRKLPAPELKRRLQEAADHPVMKSGGRVELQDLRLTPQETRALGFIDGVRSLNQLATDLPQDADNFFRLAFMLRNLEVVSFANTKVKPRAAGPAPAVAAPASAVAAAPTPAAAPVAAPKPGASAGAPLAGARPPPPKITAPHVAVPVAKPAASPVAPAPAAAPAAPVDFAAELKELKERAAKLKEQNFFEILGLPETTDGAQVKIAYFKLAKAYHPDTIPQNAPPEFGKLTEEVFGAVSNAYKRLSDDKARADYLEELRAGGSGEGVDIQQILLAEELFQKGAIMVRAKKFADAVQMLNDAINANGEEGEFYAYRAIARFFSIDDRKTGYAEAMKDINTALRKNPRCAQAYFHQGLMSKLLGDNSGALKHFQKTVELQPNHTDAQREVRLHKPTR